ncbi:Orotidine 5'-phosphate decarboxylase [Aquisphaera giovannonii]|uniref:Orotidine 5'-phosphate decarboxylase n=1 Tax=Aquisphaera giovannonii TaxID=406548 RepID=A0A5B9W248_9BACT|nr:orotidine-5'-phosphate decarboxylase [Aquisphaera giovannonii]QEH34060.1 Orotidine 5'-phosphate decarboxylase [Aquisphaera giovannonii]
MNFADQLVEAVRRKRNPVVVGIDPRPEELPGGFLDRFPGDRAGVAAALKAFGCDVLDVVAPLVPAVKFQSAFYEAYGPEGLAALHATVEHAKSRGAIVLFDGKRNDIGSTAEAYARAYLGKVPIGGAFEPPWHADAITVNPYLGTDGITPFVRVAAREQKGVFVLVRTSNASAREFQDLVADGKPLYRHVAEKLLTWGAGHAGESGYNLVGAVVGATYPQELAELREAMPGILFLVPGYGVQGGTAKDIAPAFDEHGLGAIVNNSRGITFAYERPHLAAQFPGNWQGAVEQAVRDMIQDLAANTSAGRLRD